MTEVLERTVLVTIGDESDVGIARIRTHRLAIDEGFSDVGAAALATAVSELARNVLVHARSGELLLRVAEQDGRRGIVAIVRDEGPGIADTEHAMADGCSTAGTLGLGLPSAQRLVDELQIVTVAGAGTTITAKKWKT